MKYEDFVLDCYRKVLEEVPGEFEAALDARVGKAPGLDSLGLVNLMIEIEEGLHISLETVLIDIRKSQTLADIVPLVEKVCKEVEV
ncbi:hypothetical protein KIH86_13575 [Paenibacillus sp. HN-1]|uniref:hypothetical protein n=1 Tax=Paenibacillus TaxID=44249 RepID=UPI001CA89C1A|nr:MULTISPECIES: hypothetical protein [Paenibacillus]MBY9080750.1 hypothetical protein [Paenibacillus sp. CGMCC 1.18879]MBY9085258.1 hypothetical protein [Paenibacillus sinensis]